ncbi:MAG TPA: ATP-binding protein [Candidatus Limnocylindrales bacterium]|nr:ATP-binding protein [Candidatus Limnocylindrales bacterium]
MPVVTDERIDRADRLARSAVTSTSAPSPTAQTPRLSFRSRLTLALLFTAIAPLAVFGVVVLTFQAVLGRQVAEATFVQILLFGLAILLAFAIVAAFALATELLAPLRSVVAAVDRVSKGDLSGPIQVAGDDELARLADSHNHLAADLERRNRELGRILEAIDEVSLRDDVEALVARTGADATSAFALIDATVVMGDPSTVDEEEVVPGVSRPLRAVLRAGGEDLGVLIGRLPATRRWEPADQDLLELFASEMASAIRNAQLFARVEAQNRQLLELDAAKDDFLRGVSHNLQTPLTSIRAYAEQLDATSPDRRLGIIAEQSERLSRMVRQLLMVTRLESGALKPRSEVLSLGTRVRKAWEALGVDEATFDVDDQAGGWLAVADPDQLDQVLWALLDNAVKYGANTPVNATIALDEATRRIRLTISDGGAGIAGEDRDRLFTRFERGSGSTPDGGSGLGLYVSRELCRAMNGDLVLEPAAPGRGAAFTIVLPGESADEG